MFDGKLMGGNFGGNGIVGAPKKKKLADGGTTSTTTSSAPPANFQAAYSELLGQANNVASQPLQQYSGPIVAGLSGDQASGITGVQNAQGIANPFINTASTAFSNATTPLWGGVQQFSPSNVQQYASPYTQDVLNTTEASEANTDAQQQQQLTGSAISSGAWGGDRAGVAQGILGGQQALANNQTNANIENQGYQTALGEFNQQQGAQLGANEANSWLNSQAGFGYGNLGSEAQNTSLTGANALLGVGGIEQAQQQSQLNVPYEQFLQQQAYPFQTTGWLSGITEGTGSAAGGTSTSTSATNPSTLSTLLGLGTSGLGIAGLTGGFGSNGYLTGAASTPADETQSSGGLLTQLFSGIGSLFNKDGGPVISRAPGGGVPGQIAAPQIMDGITAGTGIPSYLLSDYSAPGITGAPIVTNYPWMSSTPSLDTSTGATPNSVSDTGLSGIGGGGGGGNGGIGGVDIGGSGGVGTSGGGVSGGSSSGAGSSSSSGSGIGGLLGDALSAAGGFVGSLAGNAVAPGLGGFVGGLIGAQGAQGLSSALGLSVAPNPADESQLNAETALGMNLSSNETAAEAATEAGLSAASDANAAGLNGGTGITGTEGDASGLSASDAAGEADAAADAGAGIGDAGDGGDAGADAGGGDGGGGDGGGGGGGGDAGGGGGCFLTSATMAHTGKADDSPELQILRQYRDHVLKASPAGRELVKHYYSVAPAIVKAIDSRSDRENVYGAMRQHIDAAVGAIRTGNHAKALESYARLLDFAQDRANEGHRAKGGGISHGWNMRPSGIMRGGFADGGSPDDDGSNTFLDSGQTANEPVTVGPVGSGAPGNGIASAYQNNYQPRVPTDRASELRSQAPWLALTSAGAGILGGGSNNPFVNIGRGVEQGLRTYAGQTQEANQTEEKQGEVADTGNYRKASLDMESSRLTDAAEEAKARIKQGDTMQSETVRAHQADEANRAAQLKIQQQEANQQNTPADVKTAQWLAQASPEQKAAYMQMTGIKAGVPAWAQPAATPPGPGGTVPPATAPGGGATPPAPTPGANPASAGAQSGLNEKALEGLPPAVQSNVKAMVEGRMAPPSSFALAKPYWQSLMAAANQYDPAFDQTTWSGRVQTRRSFSPGGADGKNLTAINTALGHAADLSDNFDKLDNFGGIATPLNKPVNAVEDMFGDPRQGTAREGVDALAAEARKVFASTGGGSLKELEDWQSNFPINGSPDQQKAQLTKFVHLLDSRVGSIADSYNRGMQRTEEPINLLSSSGARAYQKLTGITPNPEATTGYPTGGQRQAPSDGTQAPAPMALPPLDQRVSGKLYPTPTGMRPWMGSGWGAPVQTGP